MEVLGHYELLSPIGRGGMAEVWLARRMVAGGPGKMVALKRMAAGLATQAKYCEMFEAETRMSMTLSHSNIVQVFDFGTEAGTAYIVMELVDGSDLGSLISFLRERGRAVPENVAMFVVGELLRALDYSHNLRVANARLGLIHRDVSPQNLLLSKSGEVKLTDFGVARLVDEQTSGGQPKGKLRYMAPEQLSGAAMDARVDLYAVGAILYELVSGKLLRDADSMDQLYGQILNPAPIQLDQSVSVEILNLIQGLLASDVGARIATASDALALVRAWPGYCDARDELADLVRECRPEALQIPEPSALSGPRSSSPFAAPSSVSGPAAGINTVRTATAAPLAAPPPTRDLSGPAGQGPSSWGQSQPSPQLQTLPQLMSEHTTMPDPAAVSRARGRGTPVRSGPPLRAIALSLGGICVAALGVIVAYGPGLSISQPGSAPSSASLVPARRAGGKAPPARIVSSDQRKPAPSKSAPTPAPQVLATPSEELPPPSSQAPVLPDSAAPPAVDPVEPEPAPKKRRRSKKRGRKALSKRHADRVRRPSSAPSSPERPAAPAQKYETVELKAHQFNFAYVKIAGKKKLIEPLGELRVPVGTHYVYVREAASDPWRNFGQLKVIANQRVKVRLKSSGSLRVDYVQN